MPKRIHIISPSGAIDTQWIDQASDTLRSFGYIVTEGTYARNRHGRFAGTKEQRLYDLVTALTNPDIDIILCARGGYGLQQLIGMLDNALLTIKPDFFFCPKCALPLIVGFSDVTVLHQWCALHNHSSMHAMMCKGIAQTAALQDQQQLTLWQNAIEGKELTYTLPAHELNRVGQTSGVLIGGNLSVIYGLQDTPYSLNHVIENNSLHNTPSILFIEDIAERHYHIERMLLNLKMSGVFNKISGLIVGQMTDCEDDPAMGCSVYETIAGIAADYSFPILFGFPAGHDHINHPLPFTSPCSLTISSSQSQLIFPEQP